jgi:predicted Ser/Thr protein kinase
MTPPMSEDPEGDQPSLAEALAVDPDDPEVMRARASIEARLLGEPLAPTRVGRFLLLDRIGAGGMGVVYAAFDPELERKVALKLLFDHGAAARHRDRIRSEAKVMAKLAHPGVVHVYEVGEHRGRIFLVMEHVRGRTLRAWWSERPRTQREVLVTCVQAGRGLAAAHAAGIVHGDFKPDNVLVGDDGRARVVDFGLARMLDDHDSAEESDLRDETITTRESQAVSRFRGTPGYMSPSQIDGEAADRGSDVFAFCVTVWEALCGERPHPGATTEEVLRAVAGGRMKSPPRGKMATRVEQMLRRGLSAAPETASARAVSLDELLRELGRDPAASRRRWILGAAALGAVAGGFAVGSSVRGPEPHEPCTGSEAAFADAWPAAAREAALAHVEQVGGEYGRAIAPRLRAEIDDFGSRWIAAHRDACMAHARGEQSADLLDRRMACLLRGRAAVTALGEVTASTDVEGLSRLILAFDGIPDPDDCGDVEALMKSREAQPEDAEPIVERLARVKVLFGAGRFQEAAAAVPGVVDDARALGHRPLLADALRTHGLVELEFDRRVEGARLLQEATQIALAVGDEETALVAWANRAFALATDSDANEGDPLEGRVYMLALAERDPMGIGTMMLHSNLGGAEIARGHPDLARAEFIRAIEIGESRGDAPRQLAMVKQQLGFVSDDPDDRARLLDEAIRLWAEVAGPEHPRALSAKFTRALMIEDPAAAREQMERPCLDMRTYHAWNGEMVSGCLRELAVVDEILGDVKAELATTERWAELATKDDAPLARGRLALLRGDPRGAVEILEPRVAGLQREAHEGSPWFVHYEVGAAETALGRAWVALDDPRGLVTLQRALERLEGCTSGKPQPHLARRVEAARRAIETARARAPSP